jgi:hypothetical protein
MKSRLGEAMIFPYWGDFLIERHRPVRAMGESIHHAADDGALNRRRCLRSIQSARREVAKWRANGCPSRQGSRAGFVFQTSENKSGPRPSGPNPRIPIGVMTPLEPPRPERCPLARVRNFVGGGDISLRSDVTACRARPVQRVRLPRPHNRVRYCGRPSTE